MNRLVFRKPVDVVRCINRNEGIGIEELSRKTKTYESHLFRIVKRLAENGIIRIERGRKRKMSLFLTNVGKIIAYNLDQISFIMLDDEKEKRSRRRNK